MQAGWLVGWLVVVLVALAISAVTPSAAVAVGGRGGAGAIVSGSGPGAVVAAAAPTSGVSGTVTIGVAPTVPRGSVDLGSAPLFAHISFEVALTPRRLAVLRRLAAAVSDPSSPLYRHYLAKGQFARMFGPTRATIAEVRRQLRALGCAPAGFQRTAFCFR